MEDNTLQLLKESGISENSIVALAQSLSKIEAYIPTKYVNDDSPDLDADNLNHAEQGIKRVTDALNLAIDAITALNSDLKWKYYSQVSQIGLSDTSTITFDQILTTITNYSILEFAAFKTDYPALNLPGAGQRHKVKVVYPLSGYVYLEDIDLSNNVIYTNRHDGNNYSGWMRLQSAVLDMQNAWVTGFRVPGWGLIVQLPYFDNIQITIAEVFNDLSQWETITLSNIQSCGNIKSLVFNFSETNIKETRPYLIRLSGTIQ